MTTEEIVTSYKTSVRLKKAGVNLDDSAFIWVWAKVKDIRSTIPLLELRFARPLDGSWEGIVNAYTLSELIRALPSTFANSFGSFPVSPTDSIQESIEKAVEALIHFRGKEVKDESMDSSKTS
jgi:hypothetical protein